MTSCQNCKFFTDQTCAVNPCYRAARKRLEQSSESFIREVEPFFMDCKDFEPSPVKALMLTLTENEWKAIAAINDNPTPAGQKLVEQVRASFPDTPVKKEGGDDIPF